jgi:DNA-directed RNA polymerase sigma subunit (sigma70/sigma32)
MDRLCRSSRRPTGHRPLSINAKALRKLRHPSRSKRLKAFVEN